MDVTKQLNNRLCVCHADHLELQTKSVRYSFHCLVKEPFNDQATFDLYNIGLIHYSDSQCTHLADSFPVFLAADETVLNNEGTPETEKNCPFPFLFLR